ncbi:MAG: hypothetical protein VYA55_07450 [Pseudomonadota bacterium]|nr:hypothetical protein [Pseudomonadota bacterium]
MSINIDQHTDAFTHHVYQQIDPAVRSTFTPRQVTAIENAIRASRPYQKHPIDLRGTFPLYFVRIYFVLLMGRDKRSQTRNQEERRRRHAAMGSALLSVYIILSMLTPLLLLVLYLLKSVLGIDLFADLHLSDFLNYQ